MSETAAIASDKIHGVVSGMKVTARQMLTGRRAGYWLVEEIVPDGEIPWTIGISPVSMAAAIERFRKCLQEDRQRLQEARRMLWAVKAKQGPGE